MRNIYLPDIQWLTDLDHSKDETKWGWAMTEHWLYHWTQRRTPASATTYTQSDTINDGTLALSLDSAQNSCISSNKHSIRHNRWRNAGFITGLSAELLHQQQQHTLNQTQSNQSTLSQHINTFTLKSFTLKCTFTFIYASAEFRRKWHYYVSRPAWTITCVSSA